jgi:hypothetical protein
MMFLARNMAMLAWTSVFVNSFGGGLGSGLSAKMVDDAALVQSQLKTSKQGSVPPDTQYMNYFDQTPPTSIMSVAPAYDKKVCSGANRAFHWSATDPSSNLNAEGTPTLTSCITKCKGMACAWMSSGFNGTGQGDAWCTGCVFGAAEDVYSGTGACVGYAKQMPIPVNKRTTAMATHVGYTQDSGGIYLLTNVDPNQQQCNWEYSDVMKVANVVQESKYPAQKNLEAFGISKCTALSNYVLPLFAGFNPSPDAPNIMQLGPKGELLFSDAEYWLVGGEMMQEFHLGWQGADGTHQTVWGWTSFIWTGGSKEFQNVPFPATTGYQQVEDLFCLGDYDYCTQRARAFFATNTTIAWIAAAPRYEHTPIEYALR